MQKPHPPIWIPGGSSPETWEWVIEQDYLYAHLSVSGHRRAKYFLDHYYDLVEKAEQGAEPLPHRHDAARASSPTASPRRRRCTRRPWTTSSRSAATSTPASRTSPGYQTLRGVRESWTRAATASAATASGLDTWKERVESGAVVAGSPSQVTERLREYCKDLRIGHLMLPAAARQPQPRAHDVQRQPLRGEGPAQPARRL